MTDKPLDSPTPQITPDSKAALKKLLAAKSATGVSSITIDTKGKTFATIISALTAPEPERVTVEEFFCQWANSDAGFINTLPDKYPNGLIIVRGEG